MSGTSILATLMSAAVTAHAHAQEPPEDHHDSEVEEVVVRATRTGRRVQDEPIRVDVIRREEIEEAAAGIVVQGERLPAAVLAMSEH